MQKFGCVCILILYPLITFLCKSNLLKNQYHNSHNIYVLSKYDGLKLSNRKSFLKILIPMFLIVLRFFCHISDENDILNIFFGSKITYNHFLFDFIDRWKK